MEHSVLKPHGFVIINDPDIGHEVQLDTMQCAHCGMHWVWQKGSGKRRGFCMSCNGITCGGEACMKCVPTEQMLENIENNRPLDYRPVRVHVG